MLEAFKQHIAQDFPFLLDSKLFITVSGGLDSMALLLLCRQSQLDIAVAHCNFNLRGKESDRDASFVADYCNSQQISFYSKSFDTSAYAKTSKTSTQIAARELRYGWFQELAAAEGFDYILTAHHLNDDLETFLINLGRGTGLKGLTGIPNVNGKIVRPLLKFSRKQIYDYAVSEDLQWREDSSNATDNYVRNHLRHHAIPKLEQAQPAILRSLQSTQKHLQQSERLLKVYTAQLRQQYMTINGDEISIDLHSLKKHSASKAVLYQLLSKYGFTAWDDIYNFIEAQSGKQIFSETHRLVKDRERLLVVSLAETSNRTYSWEEGVSSIEGDFGKLTLESTDNSVEISADLSNNEIVVDASKLQFPLTIRKWETGDFFNPYGMKGRKKLSKYFKDEKLSLIAKEQVWLLCSRKDILWVIGHRADDRFKVTATAKEIKKITFYEA